MSTFVVAGSAERRAVFALLEKRRGQPEARTWVGGREREGALEERLGLDEAAVAQGGLGDVEEQRGVVGGEPQGLAQGGGDHRRIERIGGHGQEKG